MLPELVKSDRLGTAITSVAVLFESLTSRYWKEREPFGLKYQGVLSDGERSFRKLLLRPVRVVVPVMIRGVVDELLTVRVWFEVVEILVKEAKVVEVEREMVWEVPERIRLVEEATRVPPV